MTNTNMENLPPEMQARIAQIIAGAQATGQPIVPTEPVVPDAPQRPLATRPVAKVPSLMDHTIALRQEVADMRNEVSFMTQRVEAIGQVTEAVGNAVGQLYAMFQEQTTVTDTGATYSQNFQEQVEEGDY
jgi:hypothetical protein